MSLIEIAATIADLDDVPADQRSSHEKWLRNLAHRQHLPPTVVEDRRFLYDTAGVLTVRLTAVTAGFGVPRTAVDALSYWLIAAGARRTKSGDGWLGVSHAEEVLERAKAGEEFAVHLVREVGGRLRVEADWKRDREPSARVKGALELSGRGPGLELARFSLPASRLAVELIASLPESMRG